MRLHHLELTAFGPFPGTVEVDFDELSAAGLFLLTGATGAGKTSVLDAVSFALYGQVPGDRAGAKHLRSDHAPAQAAPSVTLRLSIGDRQFRFTRSPAWSRPKLRGAGETKVQAHVLVEELTGGRWVPLTNRLDDAGLLVTTLLGMTSTQFNQVALLPQGRFQAFLRATSVERHAVLQQLFRTDRFERVEHWLVERRTRERRASEAAADTVADVLNRYAEVVGVRHAPDWFEELVVAADTGVIAEWLAQHRAAAQDAVACSADAAQALRAELDAATATLAEAERLHELRARGVRAQRDLRDLDAREPETEARRARLGAHRRSAHLVVLLRRSADAERLASRAVAVWEHQRRGLSELLGDDEARPALVRLQRDAHDALALARAFGPRETARARARERRATIKGQLQTVETSVAELDIALAELPSLIADATQASREARAAAALLPGVLARAEQLEAHLAAARRAEVVSLELVAARTDVLAATQAAQETRELYLDVREARINGMAGELAGRLAVGCSCPVCGSAEHPAPARQDAGAVGRADEDRARKVHEDAAFELQGREVRVNALEAEQASLDARLGDRDRESLTLDHANALAEAERLEPLVSALDVLVAREEKCRARQQEAGRARAEALVERARLAAEADQCAAEITAVTTAWNELLSSPGAAPDEDATGDLACVLSFRERLCTLLDTAVAALETVEDTRLTHTEAAAALAQAATTAGFENAGAAVASCLDVAEASALAEALADVDRERVRAQEALADPAVIGALAAPAPDLAEVRVAHATSQEAALAAASAHDAALARAARAAELALEVEHRLGTWAPVRARHALVASVASLVEGKSVDNPLRMRLAAYVLAERLREVVDAANERLARMTDQRYALEHSDDRGFGEQRGGLSLRVRDDWSGVRRDPATLSGGETFVVSLALALGLADTVAHEAGGTDIDTLFIDEGFGSLDSETLEDVMDTLDSLRDGGRVVGLVSHVPELRSRITTQLEVTKGRNGSTLRQVLAGAQPRSG
ncbi:MAG: family ATPase [Marmoricola sp.]|nr:family ATPase [Marmoricola sp.]